MYYKPSTPQHLIYTIGPPFVLFDGWQERPSSTQTHVWHTVGAPGSKEVRRLLMRFFGAWHYFPVDARGGEAVFPLDGTRVLALAPTYPASGLSFSSHKNVRTALRRLGMLAAATGRVAVHPMLDAATLSLPLQPEVSAASPANDVPAVRLSMSDRINLVHRFATRVARRPGKVCVGVSWMSAACQCRRPMVRSA